MKTLCCLLLLLAAGCASNSNRLKLDLPADPVDWSTTPPPFDHSHDDEYSPLNN